MNPLTSALVMLLMYVICTLVLGLFTGHCLVMSQIILERGRAYKFGIMTSGIFLGLNYIFDVFGII